VRGCCLIESVSVTKATWGDSFLRSKILRVHYQAKEKLLQAQKSGKGYLLLILLGRARAFWLLSTVKVEAFSPVAICEPLFQKLQKYPRFLKIQ
jgi:hypothetical protein